MTQEEAAELLDIFRSDNSEVPPVDALKLVKVYIALLEDERGQ